uniref:Uncharacterized protein n=1 Tax=Meloidogyne enterolobii TaxID=390850 RepID=A0A6V7WNJ1_MELEN|nr:unnamed protein product [Meloidogyne enterolobii]
MLQHVGNSEPLRTIIRRVLLNQEHMQEINTIEKQYDNLYYAYNELSNEYKGKRLQIQAKQMAGLHHMHEIEQQLDNEIYQLNNRLQEIITKLRGIIQDMHKINDHFNEVGGRQSGRGRRRGH